MFSIICVYNKQKILEEFLMKSLPGRSSLFELILIDNTRHQFNSAASALNHAASQACGDNLLFVHQDVRFDISIFDKIQHIIDDQSIPAVFGVAGRKQGTRVITNILQGNPPTYAGDVQIAEPETCQTLDEVMLIIPKSLFNNVQFDESTCSGWHLYAVDYCLSAIEKGYQVFVLPIELYHGSIGNVDETYYETLKRIAKKHQGFFTHIYTTNGIWPTHSVFLHAVLMRKKLERWLHKLKELKRSRHTA